MGYDASNLESNVVCNMLFIVLWNAFEQAVMLSVVAIWVPAQPLQCKDCHVLNAFAMVLPPPKFT